MEPAAYSQAADLLRQSRRAVALTGAGISTPSGIADFRSPETGVWNRVDPLRVAEIHSFLRDPVPFYEWFGPTAGEMYAAEPNPAHHALAELEQRSFLRAVVTQNIDGLHQRAGSQRVLELHGSPHTATCPRCRTRAPFQPLLEQYLANRQPPRCEQCGGVMKPDVVFFGEMLPQETFLEAREEVARCDLLLVVGSSLTVAPASELPCLALQSRAAIVVCNIGETWVDPYARFVFRDDVAHSLPALLLGW